MSLPLTGIARYRSLVEQRCSCTIRYFDRPDSFFDLVTWPKQFLHNTQEIKTIDFDDLDFLSQDNIKKKQNDLDIFFLCKSTSPHYHSSFYRVLLSLVGDLIDVANFD
jgi:hypothetical protein